MEPTTFGGGSRANPLYAFVSLMSLRLQALLTGSGFAAHQLGASYATGSGAPKNQRKALRWYRFGARRGDAECQYDLGFMTLLGEGRPAHRNEAADWLRRAASNGHESAARLLEDLEAGEWVGEQNG